MLFEIYWFTQLNFLTKIDKLVSFDVSSVHLYFFTFRKMNLSPLTRKNLKVYPETTPYGRMEIKKSNPKNRKRSAKIISVKFLYRPCWNLPYECIKLEDFKPLGNKKTNVLLSKLENYFGILIASLCIFCCRILAIVLKARPVC